ncbi:MAG: tRNA epoxyqueuosine(34) reductase QueG [Saprospiraceae bacterium]|nr:tRNA epoxyqueuosine(34) reductase QueG [Saprospiraceae bacterium]
MQIYQQQLSEYIKELGFDHVGYAELRSLDKESSRLQDWLDKGFHGEMSYMERYLDFRRDPRLLVPGAISVIVLIHNYYPEATQINSDLAKIAKYAYGKDYHKVLRKKLKEIEKWIKTNTTCKVLRYFVDSGPVLEREWAKETGLVWNGKNTLSIHPHMGSYFFLSCIFTDLEFDYGTPIKDYCGTCTRCIDACPTNAIDSKGYVLNASKCISYLTIEKKSEIDPSFKGQLDNWIFGCDVCQEVCPWNRFSKTHNEPDFKPLDGLLQKSTEDWLQMTVEEFEQGFSNSPLKRKGLGGFQDTARFLSEK